MNYDNDLVNIIEDNQSDDDSDTEPSNNEANTPYFRAVPTVRLESDYKVEESGELKLKEGVPNLLNEVLKSLDVKNINLSIGEYSETVKCIHPEHCDNNPSLTVRWKTDTLQSSISLTCFPCINAGRKMKDIYDLVGVTHTYSNVDSYIYRDEIGRLLARKNITRIYDQESGQQVTKTDKWWEYPIILDDGRTLWHGKKKWLKETKRSLPEPSLYRLDEIISYGKMNPNGILYLPEGEKDVETLWERGYIASCEPHGAGSWKSEYGKLVADYKLVVILIDNDSSGIRRKSTVARSLLTSGKVVKAIQFDGADKYDVTDWFNDGHTVAEFEDLVKNAPCLCLDDLDSDLEVSGNIYVPPKEKELLKQLSQDYMYLTKHGRGYLTQVCMDSVEGFSVSKTTPNSLKSAFYAGYQVYLTSIQTKKDKEEVVTQAIPLIDYWNQAHKYQHQYAPKVYTRIDFDPSPTSDSQIYNLWTGFTTKPTDGDVDEWLNFLLNNICGRDLEAYNFFLSFFAQLFQYPHIIPMVSLVMRGEKRSGKSGIVDFFRRMLVQYCYVAVHWENVTGQFNKHLASKLLLIIDDASWGGYKEGVGFLNNLITGLTIAIEGKGLDSLNMKNFCRVVIVGNEQWLVPKTKDDGRFFVINVPPRSADESFYQSFFEKWQKPENLSKILGYLLKYDVSKWRPIDIIRRRIVGHDMSLNDLTPLEKFLFNCASSESLFYPHRFKDANKDSYSVKDLENMKAASWPKELDISTFRESYKNWCDDYKLKDDCDSIRFSTKLYEILKVDKKTRTRKSNSVRYWSPPSLEELKQLLIKTYKLNSEYFD